MHKRRHFAGLPLRMSDAPRGSELHRIHCGATHPDKPILPVQGSRPHDRPFPVPNSTLSQSRALPVLARTAPAVPG